MTQTVHDKLTNQNLPATAGFGKNKTKRRLFLTFLVAFVAYAGMAQTYTTKADGNWNSASTWVGGVVPTTGAGKIINIKHDVTYNLTTDLAIAGTINIDGDTLRFPTSYNKKITIAATGVLNVKNGGFIQPVTTGGTEMEISGGRIILENAKFSLSRIVKALAGTKRTYKNSTLLIGGGYEMEGTSASRSIDSIIGSTVNINVLSTGDYLVKDYATVRVSNAKVVVEKGSFVSKPLAEIKVLTGAAGNFGFNNLKTNQNLENDGVWDARIDAFCIGKDVKGSKSADIDFTRPEDCSVQNGAPAPELSFVNPVLIKGQANKEGAEYRFSNITPGVDAVIKLKKFSRPDIVMKTVDNATLGWNKAFQPEFGLAGLVQPNQNWYIDFEMTFYEAGKNKRTKVEKADFTALDVDGDGYSISEYAVFSNPANVSYSPASSLSTLQAGSLGSAIKCAVCNVSSILTQCVACKGKGEILELPCVACAGNGALHSGCSHPYEGMIGNILQGPVQNYNNIDTNGTAVMATYQYSDVDRINFRYGAKSGAYAVNGSGIRLNSLWSKSFNLTPWVALPVNFSDFHVMLEKGDAAITWKSQAGEELSHFVVQRSTDGKHFHDIATVLPDKTSAYSYSDKAVTSATSVVYYRVVSVDFTKEQQFTAIRQIRLAKNELSSLAIATYPNPVINDVKITLPNAWQGKPVILQLYTANGTIARSIQLGSASQTETMSTGGLTKGLYIVKAICGEESAQQRVIKQ